MVGTGHIVISYTYFLSLESKGKCTPSGKSNSIYPFSYILLEWWRRNMQKRDEKN